MQIFQHPMTSHMVNHFLHTRPKYYMYHAFFGLRTKHNFYYTQKNFFISACMSHLIEQKQRE